MIDDGNSNGKVIFIIGFLALIFTLPNYKEILEPIEIIFFTYGTNLYVLFLLMGSILFLSVYLYAIDNLKYCSFNLAKLNILHRTGLVADVLYAIAIVVFPVIIIFLFVSSIIITYVKATNIISEDVAIFILGGIITLISMILIGTISKDVSNTTAEILNENIERASASEAIFISKAKEALDKKTYEYMILELNNSIEKSLYAKLAKKGLIMPNRNFPGTRIIKYAKNDNILNSDQQSLVNEIRTMRNKVAHGEFEESITKTKAEELFNNVHKLVADLNKT